MLKRAVSAVLSLAVLSAPVAGFNTRLGPAAPLWDDTDDMTIRKTVREVRLGVHISLRNGRTVRVLHKDQFTVYQDGQRVAEVTGFYADQDLPLRLLLMIDASDSMSKEFASERDAAVAFLQRLVRPGIDQSAVVAFSTHASLEMSADASSPETLRRIEMLSASGLTALFDSICEATAHIPGSGHPSGLMRHVLVLLSDGDDTYSRHSLDDAIAAAQSSDLAIYAVTAHDRRDVHWGDANLEKLAAATGGRVFFLKNYAESQKRFADLEQEIRSQYTLTLRPAEDTCGFHSLIVEPTDRSLRVRSRAGFYGDCP